MIATVVRCAGDNLPVGRETSNSSPKLASNAEARALTTQWLAAPDAAGQDKAAKALSHVAMTDVAVTAVGQWYGKTAFRREITGVLQGVSPYPWNVRPA